MLALDDIAAEADHGPMTDKTGQHEPRLESEATGGDGLGGSPASDSAGCRLIEVYEQQAPEGYVGTCLRPLGLCDLGGACDTCWYNSDNEASIGSRPGASAAESSPGSQDKTEPAPTK